MTHPMMRCKYAEKSPCCISQSPSDESKTSTLSKAAFIMNFENKFHFHVAAVTVNRKDHGVYAVAKKFLAFYIIISGSALIMMSNLGVPILVGNKK
jgi:hypothetical protein